MTEVDPVALTSADWNQVSTTLTYIWLSFGALASMGLLLLTAHAIIPSLIITGHVSRSLNKVRPVFYALAVGAAFGTAWAFYNLVTASEVLRTIYPKTWI